MERALTTATVRLAWDHAVGNFWVDTGLVVLLRQFGEGEHEIESVLAWLLSRLKGFTWNVRGSQRSQRLLRNPWGTENLLAGLLLTRTTRCGALPRKFVAERKR